MKWLKRNSHRLLVIASILVLIISYASFTYSAGFWEPPELVTRWFYPSENASVSVKFTPAYGAGGPPTDLTLTYVDDYTTLVEWTKFPSANNTTIIANFNRIPTSPTDGYVLYYGMAETSNDTAINWYDNGGTIYVAAWSDNYSGVPGVSWSYSSTSANTSLENPWMVDVAAAIGDVASAIGAGPVDFITLAISIVVMFGLAGLGYWRGDRILFVISGLGFLIYGFSYFTTSWQFSILMVLAGGFLFIRGFKTKES